MTELSVTTAHRADCVFGPGFYRISLEGGGQRFCDTEAELRIVLAMLSSSTVERIDRDGHCLDGDRSGDANTPDVVDAERWLGLPKEKAMAEVGLRSEQDYARVYRMVYAAVVRRDNRESQTGVHASIVIKKRGAQVSDA